MRMGEVLEKDKIKINEIMMGMPEIDCKNDNIDKIMITMVISGLVEEVAIECEVFGRIGRKGVITSLQCHLSSHCKSRTLGDQIYAKVHLVTPIFSLN